MTRDEAKISYTDKNVTHFIRSYTEASNRGEDEATAYALWLIDPERQPLRCGNIVVSKADVSEMTETVNLPVTLYRTENGKHTCSSDWTEGKRCPFVMLSRMGTLEHCFFDPGAGLQRDEDGYGWLIPSEKCPLVEVSK